MNEIIVPLSGQAPAKLLVEDWTVFARNHDEGYKGAGRGDTYWVAYRCNRLDALVLSARCRRSDGIGPHTFVWAGKVVPAGLDQLDDVLGEIHLIHEYFCDVMYVDAVAKTLMKESAQDFRLALHAAYHTLPPQGLT